jgi:hypothetical protein
MDDVMIVFPSGEKEQRRTQSLCPAKTACSFHPSVFHKRAVPSIDKVSRDLPSGEKEAPVTQLV